MHKEVYSTTHIILISVVFVLALSNLVIIWVVPRYASDLDDSDAVNVSDSTELRATIIYDPSCVQCTNATRLLSGFEVYGILFADVRERTRDDAREEITQHTIKRFPVIVIDGTVSSIDSIPVLEKTSTGYIWRELPPPFIDERENIRGIVDMTVVTNTACIECADVKTLVAQLDANGMVRGTFTIIDANAADGKNITERYNITRTPTLILSRDALEYAWLNTSWSRIGTFESDGNLVLRSVNAPYYDHHTNRVHGLVSITYLENVSCTTCVTAHEIGRILGENLGLVLASNVFLDASSAAGKNMMKYYNITATPTIILDEEAGAYPAIAALWERFGSIETDGSFVLRNLDTFAR